MKKNILILVKSVDGGTGTYLEGLLRIQSFFPDKELTVTVLGLERPSFRRVDTLNYHFYSDKHYIPQKYRFSLKTFSSFFQEMKWFRKKVSFYHPDLVIAQDPHAILLSEAIRMFFHARYKTISAIHNNLFQVVSLRLPSNLRRIFLHTFGMFLNRSDYVVTVSRQLSSDLFARLRLTTLPLSVPCILPHQQGRIMVKHRNHESAKIISVSRMDVQKDHETLLRAFAKVVVKIPHASLWLVGDGPQRKKFEQLVRQLHIEKMVKFFGWVQDPESLMGKADLFVLSSHWEGFPLSLIEAMSVGLPVMATDCAYGPGEILGEKGEYGKLIPDGDQVAWAQEMTSMLLDFSSREHYRLQAFKRSRDFLGDSTLLVYKRIIQESIF